ncbi:hypothetical protein SAMN05421780_11421 [Flexibacter flexilis DSM 6793]|uniref:Uncharacterized protein n=1 Tax=Flexibacter flexilis DSM 6793 TaxID=927664 RepID=A0A1I1NJ03_9BACT|nr:hypothetical protein [Flexibacter flexilis]SFC95458.1 hypothetical protein SAMN05421780_11421 [Flexibacter flexilis DSM 6793]
MTTPNVLSTQESNRLLDLEAVIEKNKQAFLEVGAALLEIQEKRLYREGYNTFEEYISEKHGIGRSTAYQYIAAVEVREQLIESGVTDLPQNEAQYRQLSNISSAHRSEVWQEATDTAQVTGRKVTAKSVSAIADKRKPPKQCSLVEDVTAEEVPQQATLYIDVPMQKVETPQPVREAGFGLGGLHKKSATPTPQAEPEPSALEEEIAELKQRPTQLEYQIALGKIEELEQQLQQKQANSYEGKEVTSDLLRQILLEKYVDGHVFINYHVLTTDLMQHCKELKTKAVLHKLLTNFAKSLAASDLFVTEGDKLTLRREKPAPSSIYPEKMYLIKYSRLASKNKLEEEFADFLRALDGDIVHDIERFFEYINDKIQAANTRHKRCKPLKKMDISSFYNHLKEVRTYTFLSSQCPLYLCDSIAVKITPVSPLNF